MNDIQAYLNHIGYGGSLTPTFDTLYHLHLHHTQTIAFENLSSFTGAEVRLDIASLMEKFITAKRGGFCYEHNTLFQYVAEKIGFKTIGLAARVRLNVADVVMTPRSHMLLLVKADGEQWIADTGFGGMSLPVPIRFVMNEIQPTPHGDYRLRFINNCYQLEATVKKEWKLLYLFDLTAQHAVDYEVFNWFVSRNPSSLFVNNLVAARAAKEGRHVLHNTQYSFYSTTGNLEKRELVSIQEIKATLEDTFHIRTAEIAELDARMEILFAQNTQKKTTDQ